MSNLYLISKKLVSSTSWKVIEFFIKSPDLNSLLYFTHLQFIEALDSYCITTIAALVK